MTKIQMFLCGIATIIVFRYIGWIGALETGLGIGALLVAFVILQNLPDAKIKTITKVFFAVIGIWAVYNIFTAHTPLTGRAVKMKERVEDLRSAEKIQPPGFHAYFGILGAVDRYDEQKSKKLSAKAEALRGTDEENFKKGIKNIVSELNEVKKFREEMRTEVLGKDESSSGLRILVWTLSIIGIIAMVVSAAINKEKGKIASTTWIAIGIILGVFLFDKLVYADGTIGTPDMPSIDLSNMPKGETLLWSVVIFYLAFLGVALFSRNGKVWGGFFFAIVVGLVIWAVSSFSGYYYHGGYTADVAAQNRLVGTYKEMHQKEQAKLPPSKHYNKPSPARTGLSGEYPVTLDPVHWSQEIPYGEGYTAEFEMPGWYDVIASTGDRISNKNNGTTSAGVITYMKWDGVITYPDKMIFQRQGEIRWIRVRGEGEHGKVKVYRVQ